MSAPDAFALGGRQDDGELIAAEQRLAVVHQQREQLSTKDPAHAALGGEIWNTLYPLISRTPPKSLAGVAVKLRLLTHPDFGIEAADMCEDDWVSLQQVRDFAEARGT